jgi:hypothetical protein
MPVPREILENLRTFVEVEIQAGRRMSPVDAEAAAAFLAAKPEGGATGAQGAVATGGSHGVLAPPCHGAGTLFLNPFHARDWRGE